MAVGDGEWYAGASLIVDEVQSDEEANEYSLATIANPPPAKPKSRPPNARKRKSRCSCLCNHCKKLVRLIKRELFPSKNQVQLTLNTPVGNVDQPIIISDDDGKDLQTKKKHKKKKAGKKKKMLVGEGSARTPPKGLDEEALAITPPSGGSWEF